MKYDNDNDAPPAIHQTTTSNSNSNPKDISPNCPFCTIATNYNPISPSDTSNAEWDPEKLAPPSYVLFSSEHAIAFLDIAPLTRGHVLVAPRKHRVKVGDMEASEMSEVGQLLPILARTVIKTVLPDIPHDEADYNIVQNNGPGAAQVIPHVHFHIIPRPPLNYQPPPPPQTPNPSQSSPSTQYPKSQPPTGLKKSSIQFGRGMRQELDDDEAHELIRSMRLNLAREFSSSPSRTTTDTLAPKAGREEGEKYNHRFEGDATDAAWIEGSAGLVRNLERRGVTIGSNSNGNGDDGGRDWRRGKL